MAKTAKIRGLTVTISDDAFTLLGLLKELQEAGLVENGDTDLLINGGYDEGSLETQAAQTVTYAGSTFLDEAE